ncbi:MAG: DNA (cytosine-5-)-methyltransferase [Flavobacteriales bacterium]|nr:MAG: DNA (cytosine-5-)-methyltransferase [Flavobacteriales bacterium]
MAKRTAGTARTSTLKVVELFAGVGGFRLGLEAASRGRRSVKFEVAWSNQWEPSTSVQHASDVYTARFGKKGHSNLDISTVDVADIPDHDLLVGGFPCQDYSVASTLINSKGLVGKKGVLWWQIHRILKGKRRKPQYLLLENVDRLLASPAAQRGRDMAVMLRSLSDLGYAVEWRVVNAADYGMPQRRRRVFILGVHRSSPLFKRMQAEFASEAAIGGLLNEAFPVQEPVEKEHRFTLEKNLRTVSDRFNAKRAKSPFQNSGMMVDGAVRTRKVKAAYSGPVATLGQVLVPTKLVPKEFFVQAGQLPAWRQLKGAKREERTARTGHRYTYAEGAMVFPDALDRPSRTIITKEGGSAPSRFKHVVRTPEGRLRRLVPEELEALNMFPVGHTAGVDPARRAFFMGNALVVGVVERIGKALGDAISKEPR